MQLKEQLSSSQVQHRDELSQEKSRLDKSFQKIKRMEEDKERLNQQLNKMLQSYKALETSHQQMIQSHSEFDEFKAKSVED